MEFTAFPKLSRLSREVVITEKIDGTNAAVIVELDQDGFPRVVGAQSRTRLITPEDDNFGFARWVHENAEELAKLGPGTHFGEWWGKGIQRNYARPDRIFSLFNVSRWADPAVRPACCSVVPTLYAGPLEKYGVLVGVKQALGTLAANGSVAAPGFMDPEGIVVFHTASNSMFKKTLKNDESPKSLSA